MPTQKVPKRLISLLKGSVDTYIAHPVILVPFVTIAFIQLLVLEMLYFAPRSPLAAFFNPLVRTLWGEKFVHYPSNFVLLPQLFQRFQIPIYIFISSFFIAAAIATIDAINSRQKINFALACKAALSRYVHILFGAGISFCIYGGLHKLYNLVMMRALKIGSVDGIFFIIKTVTLKGALYVNLLISAFVMAIFAFVFPIIMIEKKNILSAIGLSFKYLWGSFWFVLFIALIPTLFYLPIIFLRSNLGGIAQTTFPEVRVLVLVLSVVVTMFIDATIYTAYTTYYLLKKEYS